MPSPPIPECDKLAGVLGVYRLPVPQGFQTCAEPDQFGNCPLPRHPLRNGRLNQTAYSLFLFIRDIAGGDIVGWIDQQLADHAGSGTFRRPGPPWSTRFGMSMGFPTRSSPWRWQPC